MILRDMFAGFFAQFSLYVIKTLHIGSGATWPGEIALFLNPKILDALLLRIRHGIIIVAGTNGKTTTSLMIKKILENNGYSVLHNKSGANLLNGIVSSFFADQRNTFDYAVFEVDENALEGVLRHVTINKGYAIYIVLLNLFRDQLDRYGEVDAIADKWERTLATLPKSTKLLINADDPQLALIGKHVSQLVHYFGLDNPKLYLSKMQHATDSIYCPVCGKKLHFQGVYFSHLGDWDCPACGFHKPKLTLTGEDVISPLEGTYNVYNTLAATLTTKLTGIKADDIKKSLQQFVPAFGRMEEVSYKGKTWKILLSKNPTGFNESIRTVLHSKQKGPLLILLNDRIPDGTDVSWIWDVDFNQLHSFENALILSGDRGEDLFLCFKYSIDSFNEKIEMNALCLKKQLHDAVDIVAQRASKDETIWVLATYSAMLEVRKILTGRKIL